jgi:uncharacterized protein YraI
MITKSKLIVILLCMALFIPACSFSSTQPSASPLEGTTSISLNDAPGAITTPMMVTARPTEVRQTVTPIPTLPPLPQEIGSNTCPDTQPSMLMPGRKGRVSTSSASSNRVRSAPGTAGTKIGEIPAGGYFDVLAGPKCVDGLAWFQVHAENGVEGWMAEGTADEYWVQPISTDAQNVNGTEISLPGFTLTLPAEVGTRMRVGSLPFDHEAKTPPMTIARFIDYPLSNQNSIIYVYPVEDYLYYRPDRRTALERVRNAINTLLVKPATSVIPANIVDSLSLGETYLTQAGTFNGGMGLHAIAMLSPADGSQEPLPHYAFWGFSSDMKYLIFAALDTKLTFGQIAQATNNDFQPHMSLLDQIFGLKPISGAPVAMPVGEIMACLGAPEIKLAIGDWARVSVDPPTPSRLRKSPGSSGEVIGNIQPGENALIVDGPQCANGYTWWFVRSLEGLEGWAAEGDATSYWLTEPISVWYELPPALQPDGTQKYDLREIQISPDTGLVSGITGEYYPLATPLPTPETAETPFPNDPRGDLQLGWVASYAAHSYYDVSGAIGGGIIVYDLQDPLSRYYINRLSYIDCTQALRKNLESTEIVKANLNPFCGANGGIPLHFIVDAKPIQFTGGRGVRFLISSANYLTVNKMYYTFQGLSDDGRYFIFGWLSPISHPYIVDEQLWENDFGPFIAWKEGQYEQAGKSFEVFNSRMEKLLEADVVPLYPSLDILDAMMSSIEIK